MKFVPAIIFMLLFTPFHISGCNGTSKSDDAGASDSQSADTSLDTSPATETEEDGGISDRICRSLCEECEPSGDLACCEGLRCHFYSQCVPIESPSDAGATADCPASPAWMNTFPCSHPGLYCAYEGDASRLPTSCYCRCPGNWECTTTQ